MKSAQQIQQLQIQELQAEARKLSRKNCAGRGLRSLACHFGASGCGLSSFDRHWKYSIFELFCWFPCTQLARDRVEKDVAVGREP